MIEPGIVGDEGILHDLFDHQVAALADVDAVAVEKRRARQLQADAALGEIDQHIQFGNTGGQSRQRVELFDERVQQLVIE